MPVGLINPNVYLFEVGLLTRTSGGEEIAKTLAIHPLLTAPGSIRYSDPSRSTVTQTTGGALDTRGGRGLRSIVLDGTFGVEDRRVGPFGGSGEDRFQAFRAEVVRLGDALTKEHVRAAVGGDGAFNHRLTSPGLTEALQAFDEARDTLFVNFHDFWDHESLQVVITQFTHGRAAAGGATGMVKVTITMQEVGPAVGTNPGGVVLPALMDFLSTWQSINRGLASYDPLDLASGVVNETSFLGARLAETAEMVAEVVLATQGALSVMGGGAGLSTLPVTSLTSSMGFLGLCARTATALEDVVAATAVIHVQRTDRGAVDWATDLPPAAAAGVDYDLSVAVQDALDSVRLQEAAGAFFGLGHEDYAAWVESGGLNGAGPTVSGTLPYVVSETDTEETIEAAAGVTWAMILALTGLTTEEAMIPGTELSIPVLRPAGPIGLNGLPTFGSHLGRAAWGVDLDLDTDTDTDDGDLPLVAEDEVLQQGAAVLLEAYGPAILAALDPIPESGKADFVSRKLRDLVLTDPRISSIESAEVVQDGAGMAASIQARAINGGVVAIGGLP